MPYLKAHTPCRPDRAVSLIELMVAVAISLAFLGGVAMAFIQISKAADRAESQQDAIARARAAIERISIDVKQARINPNFPVQFFIGESVALTYGNGKDDDGDGAIDEEVIDGLDNDGDWTPADDRHAVVNGTAERQNWMGTPDLGDGSVDEDFRFNQDTLEFRIYPDPRIPTSRDEIVRYEIGTFDGEDNVLMRTLVRNPGDLTEETFSEPLAFQVLSLDFLYWNPNVEVDGVPYWVTTWDATTTLTGPDPRMPYPIAVYISVTVYADTRPFETYNAGEVVDTLTVNTVVNIEQMLKDTRWQRR